MVMFLRVAPVRRRVAVVDVTTGAVTVLENAPDEAEWSGCEAMIYSSNSANSDIEPFAEEEEEGGEEDGYAMQQQQQKSGVDGIGGRGGSSSSPPPSSPSPAASSIAKYM